MENRKQYHNFSKYILRTPLYPYDFVNKLTNKDNISDDEIISICKNPIISQTIYIASPPLYYEMQKWLKNELGIGKKVDKKKAKLKASLIRYLLRMATRCTPFGLFAGFTTGSWGNLTDIILEAPINNLSHTRLDMNFLCALSLDLSKQKGIRNRLRFYPNSSIYSIGDQLRYVEYKYINSKRNHNIVAVENSEYIQLIINKSAKGEYIKNLAALLVDDEISFEEANFFIDELIESQLLVSELDPSISGDDFLLQIIEILSAKNQTKNTKNSISILKQVMTELDNLGKRELGSPIEIYKNIEGKLKLLETKYELKYLFQTDMVSQTKKCLLNKDLVNDIYEAIGVLNKLSPINPENNLSKFRGAFFERFEEEEIPLLQALDTETGIGYIQNINSDISPILDDLSIPGNPNQTYDFKWNDVLTLLHRKYLVTTANNKYSIELFDTDLDKFKTNLNDLPNTISAMVQIFKETGKEKHTIHIKSAGGSSAANLIGRFCHADKNTFELVSEIIEKDETKNKSAIFAEIAHLPESRTGNILHRPSLRKYEIPYLAKSSVSDEHKILLSDLYISVKGNQILLRSKRLNKQIIPRLTSAHNYSYNALPVYQFLCDLQTQNIRTGIRFSWGPLALQHSFLPRVIYKNIILSRASWNIRKEDIEDILKVKKEEQQINVFQSFAKKLKLPDEVLLSDNDNELYLNLSNKMCIKILIDLIKNRSYFTLIEFLFNKENLFVKGTGGGFTNEFIIPFYKNQN
ncbi:MAG: lantibiotic dehydratase family protein [Bacteroidales bacterium]